MTITPEYLEQQKKLHERDDYGVASLQFAPVVSKLIDMLEAATLLDYGCGKGRLIDGLRKNKPVRDVEIELYDPAVAGFDTKPPKGAVYDLVTCIDVLEHIEPEMLDTVLDELFAYAGAFVFLTIHTGPAVKTLPDGRNAHLIQEPPAWWLPKLLDRWELVEAKKIGQGFIFIGKAQR